MSSHLKIDYDKIKQSSKSTIIIPEIHEIVKVRRILHVKVVVLYAVTSAITTPVEHLGCDQNWSRGDGLRLLLHILWFTAKINKTPVYNFNAKKLMHLLSTVGKQLFTPRGKPSSLDIESL